MTKSNNRWTISNVDFSWKVTTINNHDSMLPSPLWHTYNHYKSIWMYSYTTYLPWIVWWEKSWGKFLAYYCMYVTPDEASQAPGPAWMKENSVFADYDKIITFLFWQLTKCFSIVKEYCKTIYQCKIRDQEKKKTS